MCRKVAVQFELKTAAKAGMLPTWNTCGKNQCSDLWNGPAVTGRFSSEFLPPCWRTWKSPATSSYNCPESHPKAYSNTSNSPPPHFPDSPVILNWIFRALSVFPNSPRCVQSKTQSKTALQYRWSPAHTHWQDVSCATHTKVVSSFLEFFSFWTVPIQAVFDVHRHRWALMFFFTVHLVTESAAKCKYWPLQGNLYAFDWWTVAGCPCWWACTWVAISRRCLCAWQGRHSRQVFWVFKYRWFFSRVA